VTAPITTSALIPTPTKTKRYFFSSKRPGQLQEALSLLATGTGDSLLLEAGSRGAKLTIYLYPGKRTIMCGAIPPFPHLPSWRGA